MLDTEKLKNRPGPRVLAVSAPAKRIFFRLDTRGTNTPLMAFKVIADFWRTHTALRNPAPVSISLPGNLPAKLVVSEGWTIDYTWP